MKSAIKFLLIFCVSLLVTSCADELKYNQISLTPRALGIISNGAVFTGDLNLTFDAEATAPQTIEVKAKNTEWLVENPAEWLSVSPSSGNQSTNIQVTASKNSSPEARVAVLTLTSKEADFSVTRHITITQRGEEPFIRAAETEITLGGSAGNQDITVVSNVKNWSASTAEAWITVSKSSDTQVSISVAENKSAQRVGYVTLSSTDPQASATIKVTQREAGVTKETDLQTFGVDGGTQSFTFTADAAWTASTADGWLTLGQTSGNAGKATLAVTASRSTSTTEKTGSIYIYIGTEQKLCVTARQSGVSISATPTALNFDSEGGKQKFTVKANTAWTLKPSASWIKCATAQGSAGETDVEVSIEDVGSSSPRNGKIEVYQSDGTTALATVTVSQQGWSIDDLTQLPDFPVEGGTQTVDITTKGAWTASTTEAWVHISPASGNGNGTLTVKVDENPADAVRQTTIKVAVGDIEQGIVVRQIGRYVNLTCTDAVKGSTPCSVKVTIGANAQWTAEADVEWMNIAPTSGSGNAELTVTFRDNPSTQPRTGNVIVTSGDEVKKLQFTQPGRYLTVSATEVQFGYKGGTSELVTVATDGEYSVTASESWLTVNKNASGFTLTAAANNGDTRTTTITVALTGLVGGENYTKTIVVEQGSYVSHEYVDLGLPSGLLWATCNVGASTPEDYGNYYAWGETETKSDYNSGNSLTYGKTIAQLQSAGILNSEERLTKEYDVASKLWEDSWRMPTAEDIEELINNTTSTWTTQNGVVGRKVTSKINGNSIFMPAAGTLVGTSLQNSEAGYFWSSTPATDYYFAYCLYIDEQNFCLYSQYRRYNGRTVRPVSGGRNYITPSQTQINFESGAGNQSVTISSNCNWTATSSATWLTCTKVSNTELSLAVTGNNTSDERTATITLKYNNVEVAISVTQQRKPSANSINGHEYVDLGLPSGVMWATCNVGASKPEGYGGYYAWGETEAKFAYEVTNSVAYNKSAAQLLSAGIISDYNNLTADYDVATKLWGGTWRMPTADEITELINNCTTEWVAVNGVMGRKVTSKTNGNSIFLPAAGYRSGSTSIDSGDHGYYWSSTVGTMTNFIYSISAYAYDFYLDSQRCQLGQSVRPVAEP